MLTKKQFIKNQHSWGRDDTPEQVDESYKRYLEMYHILNG